MNFNFILLVLMIICASVNSTSVLDITDSQKSIKEKIKTKIEDINQMLALLNKTSSGRRPCIWKICSKPLKKQLTEESPSFAMRIADAFNAKLNEATNQYLQEIYTIRDLLNRKEVTRNKKFHKHPLLDHIKTEVG